MTQAQGPGATDPKKKGNTRTKLAWDALRLMESLGCETVEEFHEKLAALQQPNIKELAAEAPIEPMPEPEVPAALVRDCLEWINRETSVVWLVIKSMTLSLRPSKPCLVALARSVRDTPDQRPRCWLYSGTKVFTR